MFDKSHQSEKTPNAMTVMNPTIIWDPYEPFAYPFVGFVPKQATYMLHSDSNRYFMFSDGHKEMNAYLLCSTIIATIVNK